MRCVDLLGLTGEVGPNLTLHRLVLERLASRPAGLWRRIEACGTVEAGDRGQLAIAYDLPSHPSGALLILRTIGGPMRGGRVLTSIVLRTHGITLRALGEATLAEGLRGDEPTEADVAPLRYARRTDDPHDLASLFRCVHEDASKPFALIARRVTTPAESLPDRSKFSLD